MTKQLNDLVGRHKQKIITEIDRLKTYLKDVDSLFIDKFYLEAPTVEDNYNGDIRERECLAWCYDNDIPCRIAVVITKDAFRAGMSPATWRVFEFKNKADMVAFKLGIYQ